MVDAYIRSGPTATGGLFPIVHIWMRVRMRIRVAQLDIVCCARVHGKNSRSCVLSVQVPGRAQYCAMPAQRIWCCVVPWAAIGSGGSNVARYLADLVCPNGLGLRDGTHTHLPWARRYFPLREIYVVAHFLWETNTLVRVIPAPQTDHNPCLFFTISPIMLFFFCKMGRDFD